MPISAKQISTSIITKEKDCWRLLSSEFCIQAIYVPGSVGLYSSRRVTYKERNIEDIIEQVIVLCNTTNFAPVFITNPH